MIDLKQISTDLEKLNKEIVSAEKELLQAEAQRDLLQKQGLEFGVKNVKEAKKQILDNDKELAFYKFYYLLLKKKLENHNDYYIFLDRKPTRDKNRARSLQSFLESHILFNCVNTHIKHFQAYDSAENKLIQLVNQS